MRPTLHLCIRFLANRPWQVVNNIMYDASAAALLKLDCSITDRHNARNRPV